MYSRESRNEGRTELQALGDLAHILDDHIGRESEEDAEADPKLPSHGESSPDRCRSHLGRIDGHRGGLCSQTKTEDEADDKQLLPVSREAGSDWRDHQDNRDEEDLSSATEPFVQGVGHSSHCTCMVVSLTLRD
jgi:hypothetical protein